LSVTVLFVSPVLGLAILAMAAAGEAQTAQPTQVPSPAAARKVHVIAGEVTSVDASSGLVAVRESVPSASQKGQKPVRRSVALVVTIETKLFRGEAPVTAADLKPGDYVVSRYAETPQGALALSLRAADVVARTTPSPSGEPQPSEAPVTENGHH
jgi:hypothetical protein